MTDKVLSEKYPLSLETIEILRLLLPGSVTKAV